MFRRRVSVARSDDAQSDSGLNDLYLRAIELDDLGLLTAEGLLALANNDTETVRDLAAIAHEVEQDAGDEDGVLERLMLAARSALQIAIARELGIRTERANPGSAAGLWSGQGDSDG